eukprot:2585392-Pleurochrysis_carterae.AAC.1
MRYLRRNFLRKTFRVKYVASLFDPVDDVSSEQSARSNPAFVGSKDCVCTKTKVGVPVIINENHGKREQNLDRSKIARGTKLCPAESGKVVGAHPTSSRPMRLCSKVVDPCSPARRFPQKGVDALKLRDCCDSASA